MADVIISPNMNLPVPVPTQTPGPDWAADLAACLSPVIDQHDHSPGKGVQVIPSGLNINSDLPFQDHNLTNARSLAMQSQPAVLSLPTDIGALYVTGNELYYNDVSGGNKIQITNNGSVNAGSGSITGITGTASASFSADTFIWQQSTGVAANMDAATYILRYPGSYPTPSGSYIALEAPASLTGGYAFTLPAAPPAALSFLTMGTSGNLGTVTTVGGITGSNIASNVALSGNATISGTLGLGSHGIISKDNPSGTNYRLLFTYNPGGTNIVANGQTSENTVLRTVRGIVEGNGTILGGAGFSTTRTSTGVYTITFDQSFADAPAVAITGINAANQVIATVTTLSGTGFTCFMSNGAGVADDSFSFQAIGALF